MDGSLMLSEDSTAAAGSARRRLDADFWAFIISCIPIVKQEVFRLRRRGVLVDTDDGVQAGIVILADNARSFKSDLSPALARIIVRRRLITAFVEKPTSERRWVTAMVQIDDGDDDDDHGADNWRVVKTPSHEARVIEVVTLRQLLSAVPLPRSKASASRQAISQRKHRWFARVQQFLEGAA